MGRILRAGIMLVLVLLLVAGCFGAPATPPGMGAPAEPGAQSAEPVAPISGRVDFTPRGLQAAMGDVANGATVSLIEVATGNTMGTTRTTPTGAFILDFGRSFRPVQNVPYFLEAVKGLQTNAPGYDVVRVRTVMVYKNGGWASLTNAFPGNPIFVSVDTTALSVIQAYRAGSVSASALIGRLAYGVPDASLEPPTNSTFSPAGTGITNADYHVVSGLISQAISEDSDPMFRIRYNPAFNTYSLAAGNGGATAEARPLPRSSS